MILLLPPTYFKSLHPRNLTRRTVPERTPKKPEYRITRSQLTERGPLVRSHSIFDGLQGMYNIYMEVQLPSWIFIKAYIEPAKGLVRLNAG